MADKKKSSTIIVNRKARHNFGLSDPIEAPIALRGAELNATWMAARDPAEKTGKPAPSPKLPRPSRRQNHPDAWEPQTYA